MDYALSRICVESGDYCFEVNIIDSPGIRSIIPRSEDEKVTRAALTQLNSMIPHASAYPDLIVSVVDATQPTRHLVLLRHLKQAGYRVVVALSMIDLAEHWSTDLSTLEQALGCPVVGIDGRTGRGIDLLKQKIAATLADPTPFSILPLPDLIPMSSLHRDFEWAKALVHSMSPAQNTGWDLDKIALHPVLGPSIFGITMALLFASIFWVAAPLMGGIDSAFSWLSGFLSSWLPANWIGALVTDGLIAGIGGVAVFIPQIALLFFVLGILESSGYLARGAAMVDRPLAAIGLNGKSFVPLLSGCACAIPAIMAARTISSKKQRWITMLVIPLMTCSARLPVYGLLISLLIGDQALLGGVVMAGIYIASIGLVSITAAILGRVLRMDASDSGFQIELPRWRLPIFRHIAVWTFDQTLSFIRRAGPTIIGISVILWVLSTFPSPQASFITHISQALEPVLRPMGIDGRVGIALLLSFAAREVFVSALALVFSLGPDQDTLLLSALHKATWVGTQQPMFTPATIIGLIVFFMISMQCMSTLAVAKKEMGSWKWPIIMGVCYIGVAYILSIFCVRILS